MRKFESDRAKSEEVIAKKRGLTGSEIHTKFRCRPRVSRLHGYGRLECVWCTSAAPPQLDAGPGQPRRSGPEPRLGQGRVPRPAQSSGYRRRLGDERTGRASSPADKCVGVSSHPVPSRVNDRQWPALGAGHRLDILDTVDTGQLARGRTESGRRRG